MKEDESLKTSLVKFYSYFIYLHALESYCPNHPSMEILRVEKRTIETLIHQKSGTCLSVLSTRRDLWLEIELFRCWKYF